MRTLLIVLVSLLLLAAFLYSGAPTSAAPTAITLVNLTSDPVLQRNPCISLTRGGDVFVAWEQNVRKGSTLQQDIFARVQHGGAFGPALNLSDDVALSHEPSAFAFDAFASVLYQAISPGNTHIGRVDWSGVAWSPPQKVAGGDYVNSQDPVGVQASDGSIWLARWVRTSPRRSDIIVQQLGGPTFNVSNDGKGWRRPTMTAGDRGEVYVGWIDHSNQPAGAVPGMRVARVTASGVTHLPQPTSDFYAYWANLSFRSGRLYAVWQASKIGLVRERVWDGAAWNRQVTLGKGDQPRLAVTAASDVFVVWQSGGQIFVRKNLQVPLLVSSTSSRASQPALAVDDAGIAHIVFSSGNDVWYVETSGQ